MLNWVSVVSTVFTSAAYDEDERQLYLKFHSGKVYRYFEFPAYQYDEFLAAESQGKYFHTHILGRFHDEEVREKQPHGKLIYFPRK
jgi:KTSC domain